MLADPDLPRVALWRGAILGAIGFEVLKQVSQLLLQSTANSPAFQAFGIALILVVWINYFSRVVMYAASWAYVHPASRALRPEGPALVEGPPSPPLPWRERLAADREEESVAVRAAIPFAAGSAATLALVALLRRGGRKKTRSPGFVRNRWPIRPFLRISERHTQPQHQRMTNGGRR